MSRRSETSFWPQLLEREGKVICDDDGVFRFVEKKENA